MKSWIFLIAILTQTVLSAAEDPPRPADSSGPAKPLRGSLVICGGGGLPEAALQRFVELAGGAKARIVVIPTASEDADAKGPVLAEFTEPWAKRGAASVTLLHTRSRAKADEPSFAARSTRRRASGSAAATSPA